MEGAISLQTSKGSVFDPFGLGGFSTVKTPELLQNKSSPTYCPKLQSHSLCIIILQIFT